MIKPWEYLSFYKKLAEWDAGIDGSLRFFAKRETNEQTYDKSIIAPTKGKYLNHENEPKTWECCGKKLAMRDKNDELLKCESCSNTYYDNNRIRKIRFEDFKKTLK